MSIPLPLGAKVHGSSLVRMSGGFVAIRGVMGRIQLQKGYRYRVGNEG